MNHIKAAAQGIRSLSLTVAHDRTYIHQSGNINVNHEAGPSLLEGRGDEIPQPSGSKPQDDSLFVSENAEDDRNNEGVPAAEGDAEYDDEASDWDPDSDSAIDLVAWVNSLAVFIVRTGHRPMLAFADISSRRISISHLA